MFAQNPDLLHAVAESKRSEMIGKVHSNDGTYGVMRSVRRRVGLALIEAGSRLNQEAGRSVQPVATARGIS